MLVYDLEIIKGITSRKEKPLEGIEYCAGWHDHKGMGISTLCAYDYVEDRYRVFCADNMNDFAELCEHRDCLVSFNGIGFDNKVLAANGIVLPEDKCYDLLVKVWEGDNLSPMFEYPSHAGYGLDVISKVNFGDKKSGHGALAPIQWQRGEVGSVIDYCINDVKLTKRLLDHVIEHGQIKSPKNKEGIVVIKVQKP